MANSIVGIIAFLLFATIVSAGFEAEQNDIQEIRGNSEPSYKFEYKVDDPKYGDYKAHRETRNGDKVEGYYMLREPDGTLREVHYTADKHKGFHAVVTKTGTPKKEENFEKVDKRTINPVHYGTVQETHKPALHFKEVTQEYKPMYKPTYKPHVQGEDKSIPEHLLTQLESSQSIEPENHFNQETELEMTEPDSDHNIPIFPQYPYSLLQMVNNKKEPLDAQPKQSKTAKRENPYRNHRYFTKP